MKSSVCPVTGRDGITLTGGGSGITIDRMILIQISALQVQLQSTWNRHRNF